MTDHIPLTEARPGDIVHLKPLTMDSGLRYPGGFVVGSYALPAVWIDHIERPARMLKVGLAVFKGTDIQVEVVAIVDGWAAWVRRGYNASNGWKPVDDLEPAE